jgi:hypothetical protein
MGAFGSTDIPHCSSSHSGMYHRSLLRFHHSSVGYRYLDVDYRLDRRFRKASDSRGCVEGSRLRKSL